MYRVHLLLYSLASCSTDPKQVCFFLHQSSRETASLSKDICSLQVKCQRDFTGVWWPCVWWLGVWRIGYCTQQTRRQCWPTQAWGGRWALDQASNIHTSEHNDSKLSGMCSGWDKTGGASDAHCFTSNGSPALMPAVWALDVYTLCQSPTVWRTNKAWKDRGLQQNAFIQQADNTAFVLLQPTSSSKISNRYVSAGKLWNNEEQCFYTSCSFQTYVNKGERVEYDQVRSKHCAFYMHINTQLLWFVRVTHT